MGNFIKVKAKSEKEAVQKASNKLSISLQVDDVEVKLIKKGGIFGIGGENTYQIDYSEVDEAISRAEKEFIDNMDDVNVDGSFAIKVKKEGVFLKVDSPQGDGKQVKYQQVNRILEEKQIVEKEEQLIQETIAKAKSEWVKIAPRKPELDCDAKVEVEITKDKLKAYLNYEPPLGGDKLNKTKLKSILKEAGVVYGIKEDKLEKIIKSQKVLEHVLVAKGKKPVPGEDGELIYKFDTDGKSVGTVREDGTMDFHDLGIVNNVKKGDVLVKTTNPIPGKAGILVSGEEYPPPVAKKAVIPSGKNVKKIDENTLVAAKEGHVVVEKGRVNVLPIYKVNGDVDYTTGNIDFVGSVYVSGTVTEGFTVKAKGDIEVRGNVEGADLISDNNIVIHKGFIGKDKHRIEAKGTVKVKFVENGIIKARNDVYVHDAIMHSKVNAGGKIIIKGNKGLLVGGDTKATGDIEANIIGSSLGTQTRVASGINPESRMELKKLKQEIDQINTNLNKTEKALKILTKIKKQKGELPYKKKRMYYKLLNTRDKLNSDLAEKEERYEQLQQETSDVTGGCIKAHTKVYAGTEIIIGNYKNHIRETISSTAFIKQEGEVKQTNL